MSVWRTGFSDGLTGRRRGGRRGCRVAAIVLAGVGALSGGCHWDSFLDPSIVGRWETTPGEAPILENLAAIEQTGEEIEHTEVAPEDLVPQADVYTISSGDVLTLTLYDLVVANQPEVVTRQVDANGYVEIIALGRVFLGGLTVEEAEDRLRQRMRQIVQNPLVAVAVESRREQAFYLQGSVPAPGAYSIPASDYRLLEALIAAGGLNESISDYIYVIRQVSLTEDTGPDPEGVEPENGAGAGQDGGAAGSPGEQPSGEDLIDIIDDLTGEPAALSAGRARVNGRQAGAPGFAMLQDGDNGSSGGGVNGSAPEPVVELVDDIEQRANGIGAGPDRGTVAASRWVFLNGRWVRTQPGAGADEEAGSVEDDELSQLATQRIIRVPLKPLLNGDARYNLVVRPGDMVRIPPPASGNIYIGGQIARPGVYTIPPTGKLTLTRAITAAGGLGGIAIPERMDLTRIVGPDRQATIMLNYRAIVEGTQPDVLLKPDDQINIGTNFWALPLAVVRGGFRASYGFGFLLDRNFGNDVFGPPPSNTNN